jgi:hypothetical protein
VEVVGARYVVSLGVHCWRTNSPPCFLYLKNGVLLSFSFGRVSTARCFDPHQPNGVVLRAHTFETRDTT